MELFVLQEQAAYKMKDHAFSEGAEFCFHCYRILQFKYVDPSLPPSAPPSEIIFLKGSPKKRKNKKQRSPKRNPKISPKARTVAPPPPLAPVVPTEVLYRIEIEVLILSETFHDFVDFVTMADSDHEIVPDKLLER